MQVFKPKIIALEPKPVRHWNNLFWWMVLIGSVISVQKLPNFLSSPVPIMATATISKMHGTEKEAFTALVFGRVSATHKLTIPAATFKAQLEALKNADYATVRLEQIKLWKATNNNPLPAKPVLLTFDEANSETIEIADKILAALDMSALVFVDVEQLNQGNVQLVSWHRLAQLAKSGRWEVGISACTNGKNLAVHAPALLQKKLIEQREQLMHRLGVPVVAAECSHAWDDRSTDGDRYWADALRAASLPIGFAVSSVGANYRGDSEASYKRIRTSKDWNVEQLLAQLQNHTPRRTAFVDQFQADQTASAWLVDSGEISINDGLLHLANKSGEQGALITLAGTEKWQDAEAEVQLNGQPEGQFWVILRHRVGQPFVRLGVTDDHVVLQRFDGHIITQLASRDVPLNKINLKLRMVGSRAMAYVNEQPLLKRPVSLPDGLEQGAFALTVWNNESQDSGIAAVNLEQIKATPLFKKSAIIAPSLGKNAWAQLHQQAEQLSAVSPHYFSWVDGKAQESEVRDSTIDIFAHYHRLKVQPALYIDEKTPLSDVPALTNQVLIWASDPLYHGINILLNNAMPGEGWRLFLSDLNTRMHKMGKSLAITTLANKKQRIPDNEQDALLLVSTTSPLFSTAPNVLYVHRAEPLL
ncbi:MAG: hypothetical protein ABL925_11670 [Methylococcales bacterium]